MGERFDMDEYLASRGEALHLGTMEEPLSVGELTSRIKRSLEGEFAEIVVVGEVSNFKAHSSGHWYFSLKDADATLSAAMFRGANSKVEFDVEDGQKVIACGRISVYPPRGSYQIIVTRMEPEGIGALQLKFEQLKKKLQEEGLFDESHKKPIPKLPQCIGVVTSPTGAAIQDILNVITRRFAGLKVLIHPARVQGEGAAKEVAEGIRALNKHFKDEVDVLIVGRGGGSLEDLWCFNEEVVARAIWESKIPLVSAVGHEVDFTIADFVADLRAPTPSAAAEIVSGNRLELVKSLENLIRRLGEVVRKLEERELKLDDLISRLQRSLQDKLQERHLKLERFRSRLAQNSPLAKLQEFKHGVLMQMHSLRQISKSLIDEPRHRIKHLDTQLKLLNPRTIMERGYSIVRNEKSGTVVTKASQVKLGDSLLIELHKGKIRAKI